MNRPLAEHRLQRDRLGPSRAVTDPHDHDRASRTSTSGALLWCSESSSSSSTRAAVVVLLGMRRRRAAEPAPAVSTARRETWRMPRLSLLDRPKWSRGRLAGMYALRVLPGRRSGTSVREGDPARPAQVEQSGCTIGRRGVFQGPRADPGDGPPPGPARGTPASACTGRGGGPEAGARSV